MLSERKHFAHLVDLEGAGMPLDEDGIAICKAAQVHCSSRHVYSQTGAFDLAVAMCAENCEVNRDLRSWQALAS